MAGVRLNSEKKIDHNDFKIKIGTTNKLDPEVVYIEGRTFISPLEEKEDYTKDMSEIKHRLKAAINEHIHSCKIYSGKFILDFQVAASGIKPSKKSFLSFQFILRQNEPKVMKLLDLKKMTEGAVLSIVTSLKDDIEAKGYTVSKTKR